MPTYGDFSSLLQLGVGTGIGLSLFRAPVDIRTANLERVLNGEILALRNAANDFARLKRRELMSLRLQFIGTKERVEALQQPFMWLAVAGALANLLLLIRVSLNASAAPSDQMQWLLVFASTVYFALVMAGLEVLARIHLRPLSRRLYAIQMSKASGEP